MAANIERWDTWQLALKSGKSYVNPFVDVQVDVEGFEQVLIFRR